MNDLPETCQVIAEVIGRRATLLLAGKCHYRQLYVPRMRMPDNYWIVALIGRVKAEQLQAVFAGESIPIAACYQIHKRERDAAVRAAIESGKGRLEVAASFGISRHTLARIVGKGVRGGVR